ncbi:MAG: hypothetical protein R2826_03195 [Thermoleophilia bacterium]
MKPAEFLRSAERTTPAVVVGGDDVALGLVRDLGREGVPVLAVGPDSDGPALASRYCAARLCADPHHDEDQFIKDLETVAGVLPRRAVALPAHDDYAFALSRHRPRLEQLFALPVLPWDRMRLLANKEHQVGLAREAGVETPVTAFIHAPEDLAAAAQSVPFPAVLKPAVPMALVRSIDLKAVVVPTGTALEEAYERLAFCGALLLQELIPGDDSEIAIAGTYHDASARPLAVFTGRKLRQHPRGFGVTRLGESLWSDEVADITLTLLAHAHYHGISDVEFKRDQRDGRLKLMEVNARQGFWAPLATAAGVNLAFTAYRDAIGQPRLAGHQKDGVRWADTLRDTRDSFNEYRRGELSLRSWLLPLAGVRADAYLSLRDPCPATQEVRRLTRRLTHRTAGNAR